MKGPIIFVIIFLSICAIIILADIIKLFKRYNNLTRNHLIKFTDRFILIFSIIILFSSIVWDFNYLRYKPSIPYENWKTITLNDFRGLKRPFQTLHGETKFAFVSTNIKVKKKKNTIEVKAAFHPCRSYVYNRKLYSNELLTHEIYHFHITEYCARLMRKEIQDFIKFGVDYNLSKYKNQIYEFEKSLQEQYDDETYHSYVHKKQIEWQNKIDSSLRSLEKYRNTIITLKN